MNDKNFILKAFSLVFKDFLYIILSVSVSLNLLAIYYFIFSDATVLRVFLQDNNAFYIWFSIIATVLIALLFGVAFSFLIWQIKTQKVKNFSHAGNGLIGSLIGAFSASCPLCAAFLLSTLGIAGSLAAFPFQGLEIKVISLGLLVFSTVSLSRSIASSDCLACEPVKAENIVSRSGEKFIISLNKQTLKPLLPIALGIFFLALVVYLPFLGEKLNLKFTFQKKAQPISLINSSSGISSDAAAVLEQINPAQGYTTLAVWGDVGPKVLASGAIDLNKMKALYEKAGQPLTDEQLNILAKNFNGRIKITPENSYFLLNFFWALGLVNKNPILDEGPMVKSGTKIEYFASTGGWNLGTKNSKDLYSRYEIVKLTPDQQKILEDFAYNSYRPCCANPTAFPDCNHGMAALGLAEVMASQGATADEIFEAFKYFNSFWFPQTYFDIATYFQAKEGKNWSEVDARTIAGKDYSTPQGWQKVRQWLSANNLIEQAPSSGGGCGV